MNRRLWTLAVSVGLGTILSGCEQPSAAQPKKAEAPAKVEKLPGEADLTTIHLSEAAETRLRLGTAPVERKPVGRLRTYGGEVVVPPGRAITVSAPINGTILPPSKGPTPLPGAVGEEGAGGLPAPASTLSGGQGHSGHHPGGSPGPGRSGGKATRTGENPARSRQRLLRDNLGGSGASTTPRRSTTSRMQPTRPPFPAETPSTAPSRASKEAPSTHFPSRPKPTARSRAYTSSQDRPWPPAPCCSTSRSSTPSGCACRFTSATGETSTPPPRPR